jgi:hypothetical protein
MYNAVQALYKAVLILVRAQLSALGRDVLEELAERCMGDTIKKTCYNKVTFIKDIFWMNPVNLNP